MSISNVTPQFDGFNGFDSKELREQELKARRSLAVLEAFDALREPDAELPETAWPEPMGEAAFHGLAGEFVGLVSPETEADPP